MTNNESTLLLKKETREPDLRLAGFELWIHGRAYPQSDSYWDGNWLNATARCTANSAVVKTSGTILHLSELHMLLDECKQIYASLAGKAHLSCIEPYLKLRIEMKSTGHCELTVSITPDHLYQEHSFIFDLDQSYLPPFIENLELILQSYPPKGV